MDWDGGDGEGECQGEPRPASAEQWQRSHVLVSLLIGTEMREEEQDVGETERYDGVGQAGRR